MSAFGNGGFYTFTPEQHSEALCFHVFSLIKVAIKSELKNYFRYYFKIIETFLLIFLLKNFNNTPINQDNKIKLLSQIQKFSNRQIFSDAKDSIFVTAKTNRITLFFQIQTQWYPQNFLIPQLSNERCFAAQSVNKTDINDEEKIVIISIIWYLIATLGLLPPNI